MGYLAGLIALGLFAYAAHLVFNEEWTWGTTNKSEKLFFFGLLLMAAVSFLLFWDWV